MQGLQKARIILNTEKCRFTASQITFLDHLVDKDGVRPDPDKIKAANKFIVPTNIKQLRSFLGFCSYFRCFVLQFAQLAAPLKRVLRATA